MKRDLKGIRFPTVDEVKYKSLEAIKNISISEFQNCFE